MRKKQEKTEYTKIKNDMPLYTIGIVADLLGITDQTLRLYEKHGLIQPARRNGNRFYSENDIKWLFCVRELIHKKKISIEGIKRLLDYTSCWEIKNCSDKKKNQCLAFKTRKKPCWELNEVICNRLSGVRCEDCAVFLQEKNKNLTMSHR